MLMSVRGYLDELLVEMTSLDVNLRGESSEAPEETHESTRRDSMQDQLPQQPQPDVQTHRPTRQRVRPVCITEQQRQRNRRIDPHDDFSSSHGDL
ncbi:hypothetical protein Scep_028450 [Stephania cephalantha]|uniref:Uncharacterized protein n=1 Tax=Stephania cephalantha TaxID=152367 RepID=A0AAP0HI57_9MAGN